MMSSIRQNEGRPGNAKRALKNPASKDAVPALAHPFLAFLIVGGVIAVFQCAPLLTRIVSGDGGRVPSKIPYNRSPDQIRNYRRTLAQSLRGDVVCFPVEGVPSVVTVTARAPLSPALALKQARFAWVSLVQIRQERLGNANAPRCAVRIAEPDGKVVASVDHNPYPRFIRRPAGS